MERQATIALLHQYVQEDALLRHCPATGAIMKAVAAYVSEDPALWDETVILHDIDFESVNGDMQQHGIMGAYLLKNRRYSGRYRR